MAEELGHRGYLAVEQCAHVFIDLVTSSRPQGEFHDES
jgi:hypothetical protein